jgi:hypothetical protein
MKFSPVLQYSHLLDHVSFVNVKAVDAFTFKLLEVLDLLLAFICKIVGGGGG